MIYNKQSRKVDHHFHLWFNVVVLAYLMRSLQLDHLLVLIKLFINSSVPEAPKPPPSSTCHLSSDWYATATPTPIPPQAKVRSPLHRGFNLITVCLLVCPIVWRITIPEHSVWLNGAKHYPGIEVVSSPSDFHRLPKTVYPSTFHNSAKENCRETENLSAALSDSFSSPNTKVIQVYHCFHLIHWIVIIKYQVIQL